MPRIISVLLTLLCICTHMSASEKADTSAVKMPTCSVDGKVLYYAGNRGIQDAKIRMVDKSGKEYVTGTDMSGLFQFKSLPVGDYELTASHMGYDSFTSKYSLTEGRCVMIEAKRGCLGTPRFHTLTGICLNMLRTNSYF